MTAVDTSVAIAAIAPWHEAHRDARGTVRRASIPAHARLEVYSVLTRLPVPHRMGPDDAARVIGLGFPPDRIILPSPDLTTGIVERCHGAGIDGGAVYDALVALTAADAGHVLITRDERASLTYERLGIAFELLR